MKRLIIILLMTVFTMILQPVQAGPVSPWNVSILEIYVEKGPYASDMTNAVRTWIKPLQGRLFANIMSSKSKQKIAHIEFIFNSSNQDGVIRNGTKNADRPYVVINVNTKDLTQKQIQAKIYHFAGIALGMDESENESSVMFKEPKDDQKILQEDINSLKSIYHVKIKHKNKNAIKLK